MVSDGNNTVLYGAESVEIRGRSENGAQIARRLDKLLSRHAAAPSGCWQWTGSKNQYGYGLICVGAWYSGRRSVVTAHRLMWERHNGPAPARSHVMHTCDNRGCVNPAHLRLGTPKDNVRDMIGKGRQNFKGLRNFGNRDPVSVTPSEPPPMLTGWQREDWIRRHGTPPARGREG